MRILVSILNLDTNNTPHIFFHFLHCNMPPDAFFLFYLANQRLPSDSSDLVRIAFAESLASLAETSRRFLETAYAMRRAAAASAAAVSASAAAAAAATAAATAAAAVATGAGESGSAPTEGRRQVGCVLWLCFSWCEWEAFDSLRGCAFCFWGALFSFGVAFQACLA